MAVMIESLVTFIIDTDDEDEALEEVDFMLGEVAHDWTELEIIR